jgi:hypothetical protein
MLTYDKAKDTHICDKHGDVGDNTGWMPCWYGCDDGWFDDYEEDPIFFSPGDMSRCPECKGEGGWLVCGECNADNEDVEW